MHPPDTDPIIETIEKGITPDYLQIPIASTSKTKGNTTGFCCCNLNFILMNYVNHGLKMRWGAIYLDGKLIHKRVGSNLTEQQAIELMRERFEHTEEMAGQRGRPTVDDPANIKTSVRLTKAEREFLGAQPATTIRKMIQALMAIEAARSNSSPEDP